MNEQIKGMSERAPLFAHVGASVARNVSVAEIALLKGTYHGECLRPYEDAKPEFVPLWDRRNFLERKAQRMFVRYVPGMVQRIHDEIADLTARMRPFQFVAWEAEAPNTVCTEGKNLALDTFLAGSGYTVVGPYMGLISSVSWSATAATDVGTQINGTNAWKEAGNANAPTYTAPRKTAAWSAAAAGSKALSAALSFAITGSGTVKGAFLLYGTGAVTTIDNANGKLMSAGVFTGGDKVVANLDTLNVSYSLAF